MGVSRRAYCLEERVAVEIIERAWKGYRMRRFLRSRVRWKVSFSEGYLTRRPATGRSRRPAYGRPQRPANGRLPDEEGQEEGEEGAAEGEAPRCTSFIRGDGALFAAGLSHFLPSQIRCAGDEATFRWEAV